MARPKGEQIYPKCPYCDSSADVVKTGSRHSKYSAKVEQIYYCNACCKRWSEEALSRKVKRLQEQNPSGDATIEQNYRNLVTEVLGGTRHKYPIGTFAERLEHIKLKEKASRFLQEQLHCNNIRQETLLDVMSLNASCKRVVIDVTGESEKGLIGVECGGLQETRQEISCSALRCRDNNQILAELYVLPYGEEKPYKWDVGIKVCSSCGHRI